MKSSNIKSSNIKSSNVKSSNITRVLKQKSSNPLNSNVKILLSIICILFNFFFEKKFVFKYKRESFLNIQMSGSLDSW